MSSAPGHRWEEAESRPRSRQPGAPSSHTPSRGRSVINDCQAAAGGLTHGGNIGQLVLSFLGVEQVCLAFLYGGSPQSSNNGNMAREKDVTLFATKMTSTECVLGCWALPGTFYVWLDLTRVAVWFGGK